MLILNVDMLFHVHPMCSCTNITHFEVNLCVVMPRIFNSEAWSTRTCTGWCTRARWSLLRCPWSAALTPWWCSYSARFTPWWPWACTRPQLSLNGPWLQDKKYSELRFVQCWIVGARTCPMTSSKLQLEGVMAQRISNVLGEKNPVCFYTLFKKTPATSFFLHFFPLPTFFLGSKMAGSDYGPSGASSLRCTASWSPSPWTSSRTSERCHFVMVSPWRNSLSRMFIDV